MQMIFHLEMNWWTDIGTAHTNFGNNQNASHGEAHKSQGSKPNSPQESYGGAAKQMSAGPSPLFLPLPLEPSEAEIHPS